MIKILFLILTYAQSSNFEQIAQSLGELSPNDYPGKIIELTSVLEKEIERESFFCEGEVSRVEKNKCLNKVKKLKINYLNNIYLARKNYLNFLHTQRIEELNLEKQKMLDMLN